jgi:hypothetical protein
MKDVEYGLKVETGFINDESKFYTGFCAALNTNNGHVLMIATTVKELEIQSKLVINSDFELNDDMVSRVGLCKEKHITKTECKESKEMNEHILLVMKYLDDKNSVSKQELKENANAANAAAYAAAYADAVAANAAASAVADAVADAVAEKWINRYFDHTKEDKQTYIDAINAGKESKEMKSDRLADEIMEKGKEAVYTQEMYDNGDAIKIGMSCRAYIYAETKKQGCPLDNWADVIFKDRCKSPNSGTCYVVKDSNGISHVINFSSHIKPIDQRTDIQKAVDDLVLQINRVQYDANMSDMALKDIIAVAFEAGISFTGDKK